MPLVLQDSAGVRWEVYIDSSNARATRVTTEPATFEPILRTPDKLSAYLLTVTAGGVLGTLASTLAKARYDMLELNKADGTAYALTITNAGALASEAWTGSVQRAAWPLVYNKEGEMYCEDSRFKSPPGFGGEGRNL